MEPENLLVRPLAYVWRHQGHRPWLRRVASWLGSPFRNRTGRILAGVGRGLRFDPTGGAASYRLGLLELEVQYALRDHLRAGTVMYDVGASIGFHTLLAARLVGPAGRVIAFEPERDLVARLQRNLDLNRFAHITALPVALGNVDGTGTITRQVGGSVGKSAGHRGPIRTLDSLVTELGLPLPGLIKVDVEGAEAQVLEGAAGTLTRSRPVLVIETHGTESAIHPWLNAAGYRVARISRASAEQQHLLALPADR